jgi:hypothetical protein
MACSSSQGFASDDEATLAFAKIRSTHQWDLTVCNPAPPIDTLGSEWEMDATIDPSLLNLRNASSDMSVYNAPMQRP